ncbi:MAG: ERCC4 domain-containing protein [Thermoprotei archaeon]
MVKHRIVADYREKDSYFVGLLVQLGVEPAYTNLSVGDYIVSNTVAVERKSATDLVASILDGRFSDQVERLKQAYPHSVLLVVGGLSEAVSRAPNPGLVYSRLALACLGGVNLVILGSNEEGAHFLKWLAAEAKGSWLGYEPMIKRKPKNQSVHRQVFDVLTAIPSVGAKRAERLMNAFPNLLAVLQASEERLASLVGSSAAKNIKRVALTQISPTDTNAKLTDYLHDNEDTL